MEVGSWLHFVGVGGIGMSALAQMAIQAGYQVTGSDRGYLMPENRRILDKLELLGIKIYPQDGSFSEHGTPDYIIYSSAIEEDNLDFIAAKGVTRLHRSTLLASLIESDKSNISIAVTGSCGKSSVTAYLAEVLGSLGSEPTCINGALVNAFIGEKWCGNFHTGAGEYLVFEADESDKSLVNYAPDYALILNIGTDHYCKEELGRVFGTFLQKVKRGAVLERQVYEAVKEFIPKDLNVAVFESQIGAAGLYGVSCYSRDRVVTFADKSSFMLPQAGEYMALNALAIYALCDKFLGFDKGEVCKALRQFSGVWRRFDFAGTTAKGVMVYDDYAHNPEKIISAISAAHELASGAVWAIFQPHGYGPLGFMREELLTSLSHVLRDEDCFIMMEPYYAGGSSSFSPRAEEVIRDYSSRDKKNRYLTMLDRDSLTAFLHQNSQIGDVILIMGARDNSLSDYAVSLTC